MAKARFELTAEIGAPVSKVRDTLADLHRLRDLHPLIEHIEDLPPRPEQPAARRYRVIDRLRLGPLSFRTAYVAELETVSESEVRGTAWQSPGVRVHTRYTMASAREGTSLREEATLEAPWPLLGAVRRRAEAAHREMLAKLGGRLDGE